MKTKFFIIGLIIAILTIMLLAQDSPASAATTQQNSSIQFTEHVMEIYPYEVASTFAVDLDGDSDMDLITDGAGEMLWWENDGFGGYVLKSIGNISGVYFLYAIDLDEDLDMDIVTGGVGIAWWENNGSQVFTKHIIDSETNYATQTIDINGDSYLDLLTSYGKDGLSWWANDGNEIFTEHIVEVSDGYHIFGNAVAIDLDNDTDVDLIGTVGNNGFFEPAHFAWWENDGAESFTQHVIEDGFLYPSSVFVTDFDGDDDPDILGSVTYGTGFKWWENNGDKSFTSHSVNSSYEYFNTVIAADIDNDQHMDVIGSSTLGGVILFLNNGDLTFEEQTLTTSYLYAVEEQVTDLNGDNVLDVVGIAATDYQADLELIWWEQEAGRFKTYLPAIFHNYSSFPSTQNLQNGGFEQGSGVGWQEYSSNGWPLVLNTSYVPVTHSGDWAAWLGSDNNEISIIQQKVAIPSNNPQLNFWYWISSVDNCGYDFGGVVINGSDVVDMFDLCLATQTGEWELRTVNLSAYADQTIDLDIRVETDASYISDMIVDDVTLGNITMNSSPTSKLPMANLDSPVFPLKLTALNGMIEGTFISMVTPSVDRVFSNGEK